MLKICKSLNSHNVIANSSSSQVDIYFKRCLRSHVWVAAGQALVAAITGVMPIAGQSGPASLVAALAAGRVKSARLAAIAAGDKGN
jgi:hypothetical protein